MYEYTWFHYIEYLRSYTLWLEKSIWAPRGQRSMWDSIVRKSTRTSSTTHVSEFIKSVDHFSMAGFGSSIHTVLCCVQNYIKHQLFHSLKIALLIRGFCWVFLSVKAYYFSQLYFFLPFNFNLNLNFRLGSIEPVS